MRSAGKVDVVCVASWHAYLIAWLINNHRVTLNRDIYIYIRVYTIYIIHYFKIVAPRRAGEALNNKRKILASFSFMEISVALTIASIVLFILFEVLSYWSLLLFLLCWTHKECFLEILWCISKTCRDYVDVGFCIQPNHERGRKYCF